MPNWFQKQLNQVTLLGQYVGVLVAPHTYQYLILCTCKRVLNFCQSGGCGFICISLVSNEAEHLFMRLSAIWISFFGEVRFKLLLSQGLYSYCLFWVIPYDLVIFLVLFPWFIKVSIIFSCFPPEVWTEKASLLLLETGNSLLVSLKNYF